MRDVLPSGGKRSVDVHDDWTFQVEQALALERDLRSKADRKATKLSRYSAWVAVFGASGFAVLAWCILTMNCVLL
jgi:hypothetical protein